MLPSVVGDCLSVALRAAGGPPWRGSGWHARYSGCLIFWSPSFQREAVVTFCLFLKPLFGSGCRQGFLLLLCLWLVAQVSCAMGRLLLCLSCLAR